VKQIFLDANILIDYLCKSASKEEAFLATGIIDYCTNRSIPMLISTHSIMVLSYFLSKEIRNPALLNSIMQEVIALFKVVPIEKEDIITASNSLMADFEDAVQLSCALKAEAGFLITKNIGDFHSTNLPIIPPEQFFDFI
jgi:predicted nucleic acid-binding protein